MMESSKGKKASHSEKDRVINNCRELHFLIKEDLLKIEESSHFSRTYADALTRFLKTCLQIGQDYMENKEYWKATIEFKGAIREIAKSYCRLERYDEATEKFAVIMGNHEAHIEICGLLLAENKVQDAFKQLSAALDEDTSHMLLGFLCFQNGMYEESFSEFSFIDEIYAYLMISTLYLRQNHIQKAEDIIREGIKKHENEVCLHLPLIDLLIMRGKFEAAMNTVKDVMELNEASEYRDLIFIAKGNIFLYSGNTKRAIKEYQRALLAESDNFLVHHNLGLSYLKMGKYEAAERNMNIALKLEKLSAVTYANRGILYLAKYNNKLRSEQEIRKALALSNRMMSKGLEDFDIWIFNYANRPRVHILYGMFLGRFKRYNEAKRQFAIAFSDIRYKNKALYHFYIGLFLLLIRDYIGAWTRFNKALSFNPNLTEINTAISMVIKGLGIADSNNLFGDYANYLKKGLGIPESEIGIKVIIDYVFKKITTIE